MCSSDLCLFLKGDDYTIIRPSPSGIKGERESVRVSFIHVRLPKVQAPFTCIVAGPTGSGKTTFCFRLLRNLDTLCTEWLFRGGIIWCYSEEMAVPRRQLDKLGLNITYQEGLPEKYGNALGEPSLIILDDLLNQVYSRDVCDLFTKGSHHRNISVLLLTQNLFHQGTNCRDMTLNIWYF